MLLTNNAIVNIRDHRGNTPLHYAAEAVRADLVKLLLEQKANCRTRNHEGKTPQQIAYEQEHGFIVIPLLQPGNVCGEIADAAQRGDVAMVKAFLEYDPRNANRPWIFNSTPLQWACTHGHLAVVELLLKFDAAVDPPKPVTTPSARMIQFNAIMIGLVAESNRLWSAIATGGLHETLTSRSQSDTTKEKDGHAGLPERARSFLTLTPLQLSLAGGHTNIATLLIKHGAKIDLSSAASLGLVDVLKSSIRSEPQRVNEFARRASWLYEYRGPGFEWNPAIEEQSGTLLHFAVRAGQRKTIEFLMNAGANPSLPDDKGRTPHQLAVEEGRTEIAKMLEQNGGAIPRAGSKQRNSAP
jgi:ankyrin repeat protein